MKGILITNKGLEKVSAKEIKKILKTKSIIKESLVEFEINDCRDLCKIAYRSQSARRVILLLKKFKIESLDDLEKIQIKELDKWLVNKSFRVLSERNGIHNFNSLDVTRKIYQLLEYRVDFNNPEVLLYAFINQKDIYFGIDFSGFDLGKRDYNIFIHRESLKANIAYAIVSLARIRPSDIILDPFCKSGLIMIETAKKLLSKPIHEHKKKEFAFNRLDLGFDVNKFFKIEDSKQDLKNLNLFGFDKANNNIISAKKNAYIGNVYDFINFENCDLNWLNTKFEDNSVDKIITKMPVFKNVMNKIAEKIYGEFFHQTDLILKKKGKIIILSNLKEIVEKTKGKFIIKKEFKIMSGKAAWNIYILTR